MRAEGVHLSLGLVCSHTAALTACLCAPASKSHPKPGSRATEDASLSSPTAGPGANRYTESLLIDRTVVSSAVKSACRWFFCESHSLKISLVTAQGSDTDQDAQGLICPRSDTRQRSGLAILDFSLPRQFLLRNFKTQ